MDGQNLRIELHNIMKLKCNWYSVASVTERLKIRTAENNYPIQRVREASDISGYSVNTLNRMTSVKEFFDIIKKSTPQLKAIDPNTLSFPSLEVVKRLYKVDPEAGLNVLIMVAKREITYRNLRRHYDAKMTETGSYSTGQTVLRETRQFADVALEYIKKETRLLFGTEVALRFKVPAQSYLADVIVEPKTLTNELLNVGIIFETLNHKKRPEKLRSFFERSLTYGNFFDTYWIVFPSNANMEIVNSYIEMLGQYGKQNYAVMLIPWGQHDLNALRIIRFASGKPNPDLRGKEYILEFFYKC